MNPANPSTAFGAPGIEPRWTASTKERIGTAYHTSSRVWFTLSHGIIDKIYYPHVDPGRDYCESGVRNRFCPRPPDEIAAAFILDYADWLSAHLEDWTGTNRGELLEGKPRHYIRINPADLSRPEVIPDPDTAILDIVNGSGSYPARNVIGGDFLQLVRLGVRDAHDPLVVDSLAVIDSILKYDLPQGPCWRRYNHDGYGQKDNGDAFDGTGVGRSWPLLTGERGHYEFAAGRDLPPSSNQTLRSRSLSEGSTNGRESTFVSSSLRYDAPNKTRQLL